MNGEKKIRFGVIGCGDIALRAFMPALIKSHCAELVAIAGRNVDKTHAIAEKFGTIATSNTELLRREDVDAVYIALPNGLHAEWIAEAAKNGKHVLCEKPLVVDSNEAEMVVKSCQDYNTALLEGFAYRFHPQHLYIKNIIDSGQIGELRLFEGSFGFPPPMYSEYRFNKDMGGGALLDAGVYPIHASRMIYGAEPKHIYSVLSSHGIGRIKEDSAIDIHGAVLMDFGESKMAQLSFGYNNSYRNSYSVWGTRGRVWIATRAFSTPPTYVASVYIERQGEVKEIQMPVADCFEKEIEVFCANLDSKECRDSWIRDMLGQVQVLSEIQASICGFQ